MKNFFKIFLFVLISSFGIKSYTVQSSSFKNFVLKFETEKISDFVYDSINVSKNNLIYSFTNDKIFFRDIKGNLLNSFENINPNYVTSSQNYIYIKTDKHWNIVDKNAKIVKTLEYENLISLSDEYNFNFIKTFNKGKYGIIDELGNIVIESKWDYIDPVIVKLNSGITKLQYITYTKTSAGIINSDGSKILDPIYESIEFDDFFWLYTKSDKVGLYNSNTNIHIKAEWDELEVLEYNNNYYYIVKKNNKYAFLSSKLEYIFDLAYDSILSNDFDNSIYYRQKNNHYLYDLETKKILYHEENSKNNLNLSKLDNNLIIKSTSDPSNETSNIILLHQNSVLKSFDYTPSQLESALNLLLYTDNILQFFENNKSGIIDFQGNILIDATWNDIYVVDNYIVADDSDTSLIFDINFNKLFYVEDLGDKNVYLDGTMIKKFNGKYTLINHLNQQMTDLEWDSHIKINDSYYLLKYSDKLAIIDFKSRVIIRLFKTPSILENNFAEIFSEVKYFLDYINNSSSQLDYTLLDEIFEEQAEQDQNSKLVITTRDSKKGLVSIDGTKILNPIFEDIKILYPDTFNTLIFCKSDGKWAIMQVKLF